MLKDVADEEDVLIRAFEFFDKVGESVGQAGGRAGYTDCMCGLVPRLAADAGQTVAFYIRCLVLCTLRKQPAAHTLTFSMLTPGGMFHCRMAMGRSV